MPNLPGTTIENDVKMFDRVLGDPDLQADQWKVRCESRGELVLVLPYARGRRVLLHTTPCCYDDAPVERSRRDL